MADIGGLIVIHETIISIFFYSTRKRSKYISLAIE